MMSVVIFVLAAVLSDIVLRLSDRGAVSTDHIIFALDILIGLGAAIWFCLTRNTWKQIVEGVRDGLHGNSDKQQKSRSKQDSGNIDN